jgi:hypothetical protein
MGYPLTKNASKGIMKLRPYGAPSVSIPATIIAANGNTNVAIINSTSAVQANMG